MKRLLIISILPIVLIACNSQTEDNFNHADLMIHTSIYPIQFITEQLTGDIATVKSIYPAGVDAHSYEPTSREITNMANSDAFIYLGAHMEGFAETIVEALRSQQIDFIEIGKHEELFRTLENDDDHHHSDLDPHIWLDPLRMIDMALIIKNNLILIAPEHEQTFTKNFQILKKDLQNLDHMFLETIEPKNKKDIIVAHAAYGYWEERYGVKQIPISGLVPGNEPSQKGLTQIVKLAKEEDIQYVIYEQNSSDRVTTIIQDYLDADALYIHNLEVLTEHDIEKNEDYFSLMESNLNVLDQATQ